MRQLFKKFILIIFVGLVFCCNFNCECSRCNGISDYDDGNTESASSMSEENIWAFDSRILEESIPCNSIESIDAFDNANLEDVARNILPGDVFRQNINTVGVINDMVNAYLNKGCPMIALMRISIVCKDGKVVHHNVPYVFVSGDSGSNAINRWTKIPNRYISQYPNLYSAINQKTGYGDNLEIYSAVKGINDYKFWCESNFSQSYSHAERACVLALMSDEHHSLKNVIHWSQQFNAFTQTLEAVNGNVSKVVIQIKISHKIGAVCNECYRFLTGNAHWTNEQSKDNSCNYKFTNDTYPDIFLTKERLRDLGQGGLISIFIPIEIRISSNGLDGCCCTAASFNY